MVLRGVLRFILVARVGMEDTFHNFFSNVSISWNILPVSETPPDLYTLMEGLCDLLVDMS
jgi:hypothetical protein